jgi:hypothetical protein
VLALARLPATKATGIPEMNCMPDLMARVTNASLCSTQSMKIYQSESTKMKRKSGCRSFLWVGLLLLGFGTLVLAQDAAGQNAPLSDEKHAVEQKAAGVAGEGKVSELTVKPKR